MIRCFAAVPIPAEVRRELASFQESMKRSFPGARWTSPDGFHVTLKFLGEIPSEKVDAAANILGRIPLPPVYSIAFSGAGVFPNPARARVLWSGFLKGAPETAALAEIIETALSRVGFPSEKRPFKSHITLARFREPAKIRGNLPAVDFVSSDFQVEEIVLFRSELRPTGAVYSRIAAFPLPRAGT